MASNPPQINYINSAPVLEVFSHLPEDAFKEDVEIKLDVQNDVKSESSKATVEGVNFPVVIKDIPNTDVIQLPAHAAGIEMKVPV